MTTDVGSFKSYQLTEGRTTPVSVRVSPTEKIRAEIDALFGGDRELGEVIEDVARLGARLIIQTALEAEVEAFLGRARYQRSATAGDVRAGSRNGGRAAVHQAWGRSPQPRIPRSEKRRVGEEGE